MQYIVPETGNSPSNSSLESNIFFIPEMNHGAICSQILIGSGSQNSFYTFVQQLVLASANINHGENPTFIY